MKSRWLVLLWLLLVGSQQAWADVAGCVEPPRPLDVRALAKSLPQGQDAGHLTVMEWEGDYRRGNREARARIARAFYQQHPDQYDALIVFTTFEFDTGGATAFYNPIRNDVEGIGLELFDHSADFGSAGQLSGMVDMAALSRHALNPRDPQYPRTLGVLVHELMHRWTVKVRFRTPQGVLSDDLRGESDVHWSYFHDSDASLMYGNDWQENAQSPGSFESVKVFHRLNWLDLYLAGFASAVEVPPQRLIRGGSGDPTDLPRLGATTGGTLELIGIDQILAAEGPRLPAAAEAQRSFKAAFIVLTRPGEQLSAETRLQLEQLRLEAQRYFQAATHGRASLLIHTQRLPTATAQAPTYLAALNPAPAAASTPQLMIARLQQLQQPDGHFADLPETAIRDTAMAYRALAFWAPQSQAVSMARQWLLSRSAHTREQQTWLAFALSEQAASGWITAQQPDGSFGLLDGWSGSTWDTAQAVRALRQMGQPQRARQALLTVAATQRPDGAFGFIGHGQAHPASAALIADELAQSGLPDAPARVVLTRGWLESQQRADGGFGDPQSTLHDSAAVLAAASRLQLSQTRRGQLGDFLLRRFSDSHGLQASVYLTALSLQGLAIEQGANITVEGGLTLAPVMPVDGQQAIVSAWVRNTGAVAVPASLARLHDGDPAAGGRPIAPDAPVPALAAGDAVRVELRWDTTGLAGTRDLWLQIDVTDAIAESREDDNHAQLQVQVQPAPAVPELALLSSETALQPQVLDTLPATVTVSGILHNLGTVAASSAVLQLDQVSTAGLRLLDRQTLQVPPRGSAPFQLSFEQTQPVAMDLRLRADPDNGIAEIDESNNQVDLHLPFGSNIDLEITDADVLLPGEPVHGEQARIQVRLRNRGTSSAPDVQLLAQVLQDGQQTEIARLQLSMPAGSQVQRELSWRPARAGAARLSIEVDPDNTISEVDESNNRVSREVQVAPAAGVNLYADPDSLRVQPEPALEGQALRLELRVSNLGSEAATAFSVGMFDKDPRLGGRLLTSTALPGLAAGADQQVLLELAELPLRGEHTLHMLVDALQQVEERNEDDNLVVRAIQALALPDLSVGGAAISLEPALPIGGEPLAIRVRVNNLGGQVARDVAVRLLAGLPGSGTTIEPLRTIASLEPGASVELVWELVHDEAAAVRQFSVVVDPDDLLRETNENNNTASIDFDSQSGDAFANPVWFSPNGDGRQDTTTVVFRHAAGQELHVRDGSGRLLRTLPAASQGALTTYVWDGRDDQGRLAPDGEYMAGLPEHAAAPVRVVLDTNRSSVLAAIGTPMERRMPVPSGYLLPPSHLDVLDPSKVYRVATGSTLSGVLVAALEQYDVVAGVSLPRVPADFWVSHALQQGLDTALPFQLAYAGDGRRLLIGVHESGPSTAPRAALWSLDLLGSALPIRLGDSAPGSRILGELADQRVLFADRGEHLYAVFDLRSGVVAPFRTFDAIAPWDQLSVLPHGLLHQTHSGQARFIPADPARPEFDLPQDQLVSLQRPGLGGFNTRGSHLLVRSRAGAEGQIELVELTDGRRQVVHGNAMVRVAAPFGHEPYDEYSVDAVWIDAEQFLVLDSITRQLQRFDTRGALVATHPLGPVRRTGGYDSLAVPGRLVAATYPGANGLLNAALDPHTGAVQLLTGEPAFFCFSLNGQECYPFLVTGSGFGMGLSERFEIPATGFPRFVNGHADLPLTELGDQMLFPPLLTHGNHWPIGPDQPLQFHPSGAVRLFGTGETFSGGHSSRFHIRGEGRIQTAAYRVARTWGGEAHAHSKDPPAKPGAFN